MKWYSVKKYSPSFGSGKCFISQCEGDIAIATFKYHPNSSSYMWLDDEGIPFGYVTHFCIPEPVEIEDIVNEKIEKVLKGKYTPKIPQEDVLLSDFQIESYQWSADNWLPTRVVNCLKMEGVKTIGDLLCWCEHKLLETPNLGKKSLDKIKKILERANLSLGKKPNARFGDYDSKCQSCIRAQDLCN